MSGMEEALGIRFEGERGERFFRSTLIQTLFYGIFSVWVLWSRHERKKIGPLFEGHYDPRRFRWREEVWHLFDATYAPAKAKVRERVLGMEGWLRQASPLNSGLVRRENGTRVGHGWAADVLREVGL